MIAVGGEHASLNLTTLSDSTCDVVVIGEGERTFSKLMVFGRG